MDNFNSVHRKYKPQKPYLSYSQVRRNHLVLNRKIPSFAMSTLIGKKEESDIFLVPQLGEYATNPCEVGHGADLCWFGYPPSFFPIGFSWDDLKSLHDLVKLG